MTAGVVNVNLPEIACLMASDNFCSNSVSFEAYKGLVVPPAVAPLKRFVVERNSDQLLINHPNTQVKENK